MDLHQMRIGWRRTRSALKLAADGVPAASFAPLDDELHWLAHVLGPARDYDVFTLETLPKVAAEFRADRDILRLRRRAAARRRRLAGVVRETLAGPRFQQLLLALGACFAALTREPASVAAPVPAREWILPVLDARHQKLRKRAKHAHRLAAAERHRARVAAKKLRYVAEFFVTMFPGKRADGYIAALSKLQSALGRLNDLEVANKIVDELVPRDGADAPAAHAGGVVRGWLAASAGAELKRLREVQRAYRKCGRSGAPEGRRCSNRRKSDIGPSKRRLRA